MVFTGAFENFGEWLQRFTLMYIALYTKSTGGVQASYYLGEKGEAFPLKAQLLIKI